MAASKAKVAAKAQKNGSFAKKAKKVRTNVTFHATKTLKLQRKPLYERKPVAQRTKFDKFAVVQFPVATDTAMKKIEDNNTLTFIVDVRSNKRQIKQAIKELYEVDVAKVNTLIRPDVSFAFRSACWVWRFGLLLPLAARLLGRVFLGMTTYHTDLF
ncbi:MAG: hypothetical protein MHM6MM_004856 [Cercozoa sp. M6MM]